MTVRLFGGLFRRGLLWGALLCGLVAAGPQTVTSRAYARSGTAAAPTRPVEVAQLKAFDVLERHCARCHQAGRLQRAKPAAEIGNILRLDEIARDPHLVRPGNPDASRLYTLMLARRMPYDAFQEGGGHEAPSPDDLDTMRSWIAALSTQQPQACSGRAVVGEDAMRAAITADLERAKIEGAKTEAAKTEGANTERGGAAPVKPANLRYLSLANLWNACASEPFLDAARRAASTLLNTLARGDRPVAARAIVGPGVILAVDLDAMNWPAAEWDQWAELSPYASSAGVRLDWLAFAVSEETRKRAGLPGARLGEAVRTTVLGLAGRAGGFGAKRLADPQTFRAAMTQAGLDPAPVYDQIDMVDLLAAHYTHDLDAERAAAELGIEPGELARELETGPPERQRLRLRLDQGGLSRVSFETLYAPLAGHILGGLGVDQPSWVGAPSPIRDRLTLAALGRLPNRAGEPFEIEMVPAKSAYNRDEPASLVVRSEVDCHLTLVSVSPSGRAVVLLPNDWDRNTFLPAGKEQRFPRDDSPFRLRLDTPGWETIIAGCNPAEAVFDGIQHDFNLEKFTSLGDYRRFLMRNAEGIPMLTPPTPPGEKAPAKRPLPPGRREGGKADGQTKPSPAARTAIRFEVR